MNYKVLTWGCQMNVHDSEVISGVLEKLGYCAAVSLKDADIIILNTCCVRDNAERKVYGRIAQLKAFKQKNPNLILAISGCMVQQPHVAEYITEHFPYVDLLLGIRNVHKLPELIENAREANLPMIEITHENNEIERDLPVKHYDNIKAWVNITYGCNNFCSYCIVPYVRGREVSRRPENIINEIQSLADRGFMEITLLGQNVNSYGNDLGGNTSFPQLIRQVNGVPGISRIRFVTSHPKDLSDELITAMKKCDKICEHIHLPVQSGSDRVLDLMRRKYNRSHYMDLVRKLRHEIPEVAITTDVIVGFPGETEEDFLDTLDLFETIEFDSAFTFMYSRRKGTPAAEMEDQVEEEIKRSRLERLMKVQDNITARKNSELVGSTLEVLVEGLSKGNAERLSGRSRTNKLINFEGPEKLIGKLVNVKIVQARTWSLLGQVVDQYDK